MKKVIVLLTVLIGFLQSCTINTEFVFHNDNTSTLTLEVEMKEDAEKNATNQDSTKVKLPTEWTSVYDVLKEEGKAIPPDSVEIAKKTFIKGMYKDEKNTGFGFRFERLTNDEWEELKKSQKQEEKMLSSLRESSTDWDGKRLIINLEELIKDDNETEEKPKTKKGKKKDDDFGEQIASSMLGVFDIQMNLIFKFDNEIKSIKGKHKNFKQIDKHTAQFNINLKDEMEQSSKKKKHDKYIIIETK